MFSPLFIVAVFVSYMGVLFLVALWTERRAAAGRSPVDNGVVYALSLAVYCTSWTFYGSVGKAATSGMLFLTVYLGPTLGAVLWWVILRRMVRLKTKYRLSSIADLISARYDKSQRLAALATVIALVGIMPYIALQLKSVITTFGIIAAPSGTWLYRNADLVVLTAMVAFTIVFGVRRLAPAERHEGMIMALAVECLVKLATFLAVGIFVTWHMYDGPADLFGQLADSPYQQITALGSDPSGYPLWCTYLLLSTSAILFLPRQFHVSVVENVDERHIRTAMWLFPLYLFVINIFIIPITAGGLLSGMGKNAADTFVLELPLRHGSPLLVMLVFIGGVSAATGMIMISAMTLSTMATNHLLLPAVSVLPRLSFLSRHLLGCRWAFVCGILLAGYWFEQTVGKALMLVNIGMISFAAVLQFAPAILGALFWQRGSKAGALMGLSAGAGTWFYTLLIPSFYRSGHLAGTLLERGPFGLALLNPERLFGLGILDPLSHAVFWTLLLNTGCYVLGSLLFSQSDEEQQLARAFCGILGATGKTVHAVAQERYIPMAKKRREIETLLCRYFDSKAVATATKACVATCRLSGKRRISITELVELHGEVEKFLAGAIGCATARVAMKRGTVFSDRESRSLSSAYGKILADMRLSPDEVMARIDYYKDREQLLTRHWRELEQRVRERDHQIEKRKKAEGDVRKMNEELEERVTRRTAQLETANRELDAFAYSVSHDLRSPLRAIDGFSLALLEDYQNKLDTEGKDYLLRVRKGSQRMGQLIDDILKLSRLTRGQMHFEPVDLSRMAREVAGELTEAAPSRRADFEIAPSVCVTGDPQLLRVAMENLLGNAWKFTSRKPAAKIAFGTQKEGITTRYFIRDNGAGFDMAYADKLFGAFQRLHGANEFSGTGIGLATVQRVIHRHGGHIWAESAVDYGTTFYFTLGTSATGSAP